MDVEVDAIDGDDVPELLAQAAPAHGERPVLVRADHVPSPSVAEAGIDLRNP